MSSENQNSNARGYSNQAFVDGSALRIRLDTEPLLEKIEIFLRGQKIELKQTSEGEFIPMRVNLGEPYCNEIGVQQLLNYVSMIINTQTVQGNYEFDRWVDEIVCIHKDLAYSITLNSINWGLCDVHRDFIVAKLMLLIKPFMSRLIENKERESYAQTIKTSESNTLQQKSGFNLFNQGG